MDYGKFMVRMEFPLLLVACVYAFIAAWQIGGDLLRRMTERTERDD